MLVNLTHILPHARKNGYAIGAFNINNLETAQAIVNAAVALKSPIILQTSEGALEYAGMVYLAGIAHIAGRINSIPIVFHLDHGKNFDLVLSAIESGLYTSVMYDGSSLSFEENVRNTKKIIERAHAKNISVEAELGRIYGVEDTVSVGKKEATYTDPDEAEEFVKRTKCDALAIAIGTAHGSHKADTVPKLDLVRLKKIAQKVSVPLVLHGASSVSHQMIKKLKNQCSLLGDCGRIENAQGIPETQIKKAVALGVAKVNIDTDLRIAFTASVRETLMHDATVFDPRKILGPARNLMEQIVQHKIKLLGSAGKG